MGEHLKGKVAVVPGSGQGIGREIAKALAAEGAKVITNNRKPATNVIESGMINAEKMAKLTPEMQQWVKDQYAVFNGDAETTAKEIREAGGEATACFADITNYDDAKRLMDFAAETYGTIDILVNVAAAFGCSPIEKMPEEMWDSIIGVKPTGYFHTIRHAVPYMIKNRWGRIINCSSPSFMGGDIRQAAYCTANAGAVGLAWALASELAQYNITCNAFAPCAKTRASVDMEVFDKCCGEGETTTISGQPLFRFDDNPPAENLAPFIAYLASDEAKDVTGSVFLLNGNFYGLYTNPQITTHMFKAEGKWTVDEIAKTAPETLFRDYHNINWKPEK